MNRVDRTEGEDEAERGEEEPGAMSGQEAAREIDERRAQLEDPKEQQKINNPDVLHYTLQLQREKVEERKRKRKGKEITEKVIVEETVERPITIRVAFTPNDIQKRNIADFIESHYRLCAAECASMIGAQSVMMIDFLERQPQFASAGMSMPAPRNLARRIVHAMATADDGKELGFEEIALGMIESDLAAFQLVLLYRFLELVMRVKKPSGQR